MPELRKDPIVGRWVIIAHERAKRPHDFESGAQRQSREGQCPFCEGNESATPPELYAQRAPELPADGPGWQLRVIPNKYPALRLEGELQNRGDGIYDLMAGVGAHEVIIESPRHHISLSEMDDAAAGATLKVYRERLIHLKQDDRLVYGMLFKNVGVAAGASLEHTHSQLIVTPIVPISVWEEMTGALEFFNYRGRCIYCDMIQQELKDGARVVIDSEFYSVICPFASRFPFEMWVLPKLHSSHFEHTGDNGLAELATVLRQALVRLETVLDRPAYNYIIHTAPFDHQALPHYHWHIEIIPRLTRIAGFEWGSGFYINPVPPEDAARFLREANVRVPVVSETQIRK
jgi:UDPglucose--hexose-1-phosphate uridylyltransferase